MKKHGYSAKKLLLPAAILVLLFTAAPQKAYAGAWTLPKYNVWAEYYEKYHYGEKDCTNSWNVVNKSNGGKSWGYTVVPNIEFGATDSLTLLASGEYKEEKYKEFDRPSSWGPFSHKNNSWTRFGFGGRYRFFPEPVVLSTQLKALIYTGYGLPQGAPTFDNQPGLGDGNDSLDWRMLVGKEFDIKAPPTSPVIWSDKIRCYFDAEAGLRYNNRSVASQIPLYIEGGFWLCDWIMLNTELDTYLAIPGTGSIKKSYGIWRIGASLQTLPRSDPIRKTGKQFNIQVQYGMLVFGENTSDDQEVVVKLQTQF